MKVIKEIPASSSDSESNSDEDEEVIFSQHEIQAVNEGSSDEEDESSDEKDEEMDRSTNDKCMFVEVSGLYRLHEDRSSKRMWPG